MSRTDLAFPGPYGETHKGMELRDYFAAKAMQALIARNYTKETIASSAYCIADVMMEARTK